MQIGHSPQYDKPCIQVEDGDHVDHIIATAIAIGAWIYEEAGDVKKDIKAFVVDLADADRRVGPEIYTERALRASFPKDGIYRLLDRTA